MLRLIKRIYWILQTQLGLDLRTLLRSPTGFFRYTRDYVRFRSMYRGRMEFVPCLNDWREEGGSTRNEYFWQDLIVARKICAASPRRHVDIGSRVDGFIAHLASFREVEVLDVRPITTSIPGIRFWQADLMQAQSDLRDYCDSLSCLHALEHFGLGRYGDPLHPRGFAPGLASIADILQTGGTLYLSVPIGRERVEFNANWVFDPRTILAEAATHYLQLSELMVVRPGGHVETVLAGDETLAKLAAQTYALGIFVFSKAAPSRENEQNGIV